MGKMATKKLKERKYALAEELKEHFQNYTKLFMVDCDNVGSNQIQQIRIALRGKAILYCGKNTQMRRVLRELENDGMAQLEKVRMRLKLNVALVFTNEDLPEVRDLILENKVAAPARAGSIAQSDVVVPAGNTGMEPTMTSFLQALNIPSKITKGSIEILNPVRSPRQARNQAVLLWSRGQVCVRRWLHVRSSRARHHRPPHRRISAILHPSRVRKPLGYCSRDRLHLQEAEQIKEFIANPEAFASAAPAAAASSADAAAPAAEAKKESSSDDAGGAGGMFEDDY